MAFFKLRTRIANAIQKFLELDGIHASVLRLCGDAHEFNKTLNSVREEVAEDMRTIRDNIADMHNDLEDLSGNVALVTSMYNLPANDEPPTRADTRHHDPHVGA